jgi:beta-1,2-mannobiose phosphorylase / 1,2-beta-oligomannan phosphorylase
MSSSRIHRALENPILTPIGVSPSRPDLEVVGVFNPAAIRIGSETVLLVRVAEAPRGIPPGELAAAVYDAERAEIVIHRFRRDAPGVEAGSDSRVFTVDGDTYLTSISHLRVARSADGIHFDVESEPALSPGDVYESFGVEDPRITEIDGTFLVNYTAVSPAGIATGLASTSTFRTFERRGIIFAPPNRDVTIFPERIDGRYVALHRPMPEWLGHPSIWIASSPDLVHWGDHHLLAGPRPGTWDDLKIGGGAVPFRVRARGQDAWLAVYHGVSRHPLTYALGALLLDARDPRRVLARSRTPILAPEADYERSGFFGNVVFTCGLVARDDLVRIYYGAADGVTAVADLSLAAILEDLA